jgi:hypothetical protein
LIIIFICLVIVIIIERIKADITSIGITILSGLARAFLDTIEKYLFEFDNLNPFKVMMLEGFINTILIICLYFFDNNSSIKSELSYDDKVKLIYLIFLLILYFIFSILKNIYRVVTIKLYSPMTRALAESFLSPIIIIFSLIKDLYLVDPKDKNLILDLNFYFDYGINIFLSIIMAFCSCVYNDFIVLYFCGLEHDTYLEVSRRSFIVDKNPSLPEENSSSSDEEDDTELKNINN